MSAELSITVKIGAAIGGTIGALRSVLHGTRDMRRSTQLLRNEYRQMGRDIQAAAQTGGAALTRLQQQHTRLGGLSAICAVIKCAKMPYKHD